MKPLYSSLEFEKSKTYDKLPLECEVCTNIFYQQKRIIQRAINKIPGHHSKYCSNVCANYHKKNGQLYKCKNCDEFVYRILSQVKGNIFCSQSCSAIYNNINQEYTIDRKNKIKKSINDYHELNGTKRYKSCKLNYSKCLICNTNIISRKPKKYCGECYSDRKSYSDSCCFRFNVYQYPDKFDLNLINIFGWYSTPGSNKKGIKNINGISRDHMYSVQDGFLNNVSPKIIKHPANCNLVRHQDNQKKNIKSSITLDELMERIKNWN